MGLKLFCGGLDYNKTDEASLRAWFEGEGFIVSDAIIMRERETGKHRGFGFITLETDMHPDDVITQLPGRLGRDGKKQVEIDGRNVTVNKADPKPVRSREHGAGQYKS